MTDQTQQSRTETGGFNWERAAACTLCIGAGVLALRLFFRYLLGVLMPFALAYLLARLLRPAVDFLTGGRRRQTASTRAGRRVLSATLVVLFTGLVVWLTVAGVRRGVGELENLLLRLQDVLADGNGQADGAPGFSRALDYIWSVSEHLPFLRRFESTPGFSRFCDWLDGAVRTLSFRNLFQRGPVVCTGPRCLSITEKYTNGIIIYLLFVWMVCSVFAHFLLC